MPRASRSHMCAYARPTPKARAPRRVLSEEEKAEAALKREAKKLLKEKEAPWKAALPPPWVDRNNLRHPVGTDCMYKTDAMKAFQLTEQEMLTLPHESIPGSPKTFFALKDVKALHLRKLAAGVLTEGISPLAHLRLFSKSSDNGRRTRKNFHEGIPMPVMLYEQIYGEGKKDKLKL